MMSMDWRIGAVILRTKVSKSDVEVMHATIGAADGGLDGWRSTRKRSFMPGDVDTQPVSDSTIRLLVPLF
jgi:hypothetical protein